MRYTTKKVGADAGSGKIVWIRSAKSATRTSMDKTSSSIAAVEVVFPTSKVARGGFIIYTNVAYHDGGHLRPGRHILPWSCLLFLSQNMQSSGLNSLLRDDIS